MSHYLDVLGPLGAFLTSLAIGLLIGLERERKPDAKAGLRTFSLVAMFGTLCAMLAEQTQSAWLLAGGMIVLGAMMIAAYKHEMETEADPGTTTVAAALFCYGLGALIWYKQIQLAISLAIITTILLYFKAGLKGASKQLERKDLVSILQFAVLSFVILPILPNQDYGPFNAINPYQIWWMVVLISGLSLAGYAALRLMGQQHGALLTGLFGGLASSTATTLTFARTCQANPLLVPMAGLVILIANWVVLIRLAIVVAIVTPDLFLPLAGLFSGGAISGAFVILFYWQRLGKSENSIPIVIHNPTEMRTALGFGTLYAGILFITAWLTDAIGNQGLYIVGLISGLTDVDAITLSGLRLFALGNIDQQQTLTLILIAQLANIGFKFALATSISGKTLGLHILPGMLAVAVGMLAAWLMLI